MLAKFNQTDKLPGTLVITDFAERRARELAREETSNHDSLEPGTKLDRYLIIEKLGGGGMGIVYKAQDTQLQRTVALKILPSPLCQQVEYIHRFRAEAQAHARLNHPNIITLYSSFESIAGAVLVMEYVEGQTLEQRIKRSGTISSAEAIRIFDMALRGVEHIHARGIVHRDLKPGNIFLTQDGQVKLIDFGVAKIMDQPERSAHRTMVGTLLYISPEQINGYTTDFRSDVYTLGVTLFETVTGRLPFERRSDYALMHAHVQERPPRPTEFQRRLPQGLEWTIMKAIEKDPSRRFQSASEFRRTLLKLGLVERRGNGKEKAPDLVKQKAPATGPTSRRLLAGLCVDTALIASVIGLVYTLGVYPLKASAPVAQTPASKTATAVAAAPKVKTPIAPAAKRETTSKKIMVASNTPEKSGDKYGSLRRAWSD